MRKIILIMSFFLIAACMSEIKPILKPAPKADIATRIANQQKWLNEAIGIGNHQRCTAARSGKTR